MLAGRAFFFLINGANIFMNIPTLEKAKALILDAKKRNPGVWVNHSLVAAKAAQAIAHNHPALDPQVAFILGYLHDIGRREGATGMRHAVDGFQFLTGMGFDTNIAFIQKHLDRIEYNEYDKLIQLCDALSLPSGYCLMEKRLVDVTLRYGVNEYTLPRWQAFLDLQHEFEQTLHRSIYDCLPGVIENTFKSDISLNVN
jgi:putative nucleotidyltransferase with HDIG domain